MEQGRATHAVDKLRQDRIEDGICRDARPGRTGSDEVVERFRAGEDNASECAQVCGDVQKV